MHYEAAFEALLRARRIPYVAVDEARRTLLPEAPGAPTDLKSFDFVVYGPRENLLIEIKGRRAAGARAESWTTADDVHSLLRWETLFGAGFTASILFLCWADDQPRDGAFHEVFSHNGRWYAPRLVRARDYAALMRPRSPRWGTVDLAPAQFRRVSTGFTGQFDYGLTG